MVTGGTIPPFSIPVPSSEHQRNTLTVKSTVHLIVSSSLSGPNAIIYPSVYSRSGVEEC